MARGSHVTRVKTTHETGAHLSGDVFEKVGVFAYLTSGADTVCTSKDTWYPIGGTFANAPLEGFTITAGPPAGIVFAGDVSTHFEIDWHASLAKGAGSSTVKVGILINNVEVASSIMTTLVTTVTLQMSGTVVAELDPDDVVTLAVQSSNDTDTISFVNYTTTIAKFFATPNA